MIRSAAGKVMWVGRATALPVVLAVMLVVVFGVNSPASAHGGYKGLLHLGHSKAVAKVTTLVGKVATGPALVVNNPSGGSALGLQVNAGQAPLTVNADAGKATNLNADKVDGRSFTCPNTTLFHEGMCIETTKRPQAPYFTAEGDCLDEGRRLPTIGELQTFAKRSGHDFSTIELSSELDRWSETSYSVHAIGTNGRRTIVGTGTGSALYYRCVAPAL